MIGNVWRAPIGLSTEKKTAETMAGVPAVEESGSILAIQKGRLRGESI
jgi:hypothetical protein